MGAARNLGSTLGATAFGAVLNYGLAHSKSGVIGSDALRHLLEAPTTVTASGIGVRDVLQGSLHLTFWAVFAVSVLTVATALWVPSVALSRLKESPAE